MTPISVTSMAQNVLGEGRKGTTMTINPSTIATLVDQLVTAGAARGSLKSGALPPLSPSQK